MSTTTTTRMIHKQFVKGVKLTHSNTRIPIYFEHPNVILNALFFFQREKNEWI